jgi:hypothetical protein
VRPGTARPADAEHKAFDAQPSSDARVNLDSIRGKDRSPTATMTATETMRLAWRTFTYVASIRRYGESPSIGAGQEGPHRFIDLFAEPADLALGDAAHAHRLE